MSVEAQTFVDKVLSEVVISEESRPLTQVEYDQIKTLAESDQTSIQLSTQALENLRPYLYKGDSRLEFAFTLFKLAGLINLVQWKEVMRHLELDYVNQTPDISRTTFFGIFNRVLSDRRAEAQ